MHKVGKSSTPSYVKFPASIPGQFAILNADNRECLGDHPLRESWQSHEIENVCLLAAPEVRIARCFARGGDIVGFFVGDPVDVDAGRLISGDIILADPPAEEDQLHSWVEEQVYRFAGRYVFVLTLNGSTRLYVDAAASLPVVYDAEFRIAGSTAGAVYTPDEFCARFDAYLFDRMDVMRGGWFPAGLTPHRGLRRLLCNFYLDLNDWSTHRHWPREINENLDGTAELVGEGIRRVLSAYLRSGSCCMALTGGNETRLLLSLARPCSRTIEFVCFCDTDTARDRIISEKIADRFGLRLRVLGYPHVSEAEANEWMARTGYCAAEHRYRYKGVQQLSEFDFCIGGSAGEVGRGFFWRRGDGNVALTAGELYARLGLPMHPAAEQFVENWANTLPTDKPLLQLDLAYLELRLSCWFAVQTYGSTGPKHGYPMISREVFTRMLELPASWRRENRWIRELIQAFWPELLSVPINSLGPVREALRSLQRVTRQPSLITKRLKRRFG